MTGRLPAPVESAAYFAVAEALANMARHSGARFAFVVLRRDGDRLHLEVGDDGHGGADPSRGTGLNGIERRLAAFDGTMALSSPPGGPTIVTMELPCVSSSAQGSGVQCGAIRRRGAAGGGRRRLPPSDDDNRRVLAVLAYLDV